MAREQKVTGDFPVDQFQGLIGPDRTRRLRDAAERIRQRLDGGTLWYVNSTGAGGGVAEMLQTLVPLYRGLGVPARWAVIEGGERFFAITKRLGAALYGSPGDGGPLGAAERADYLAALEPANDGLRRMVGPRDVLLLQDHQTAGLVPRLRGAGQGTYWRCHVGVDEPNEWSQAAWDLVAPLVGRADGLVFSVGWHVPPRLRDRLVAVMPPFISPYTAKNRELSAPAVASALTRCGLTRGTPAGEPVPVVLEAPPEPGLPLLVQVSRWDQLKDMHGVLRGFASHVDDGYLALVGPDPYGVPDDPEQYEWFARCRRVWHSLPYAQRRRAALVCLPMRDLTDNALLVNAVQRAASVVTQKSLAEGFGLTVTEAMWKGRPVVASAVGGIQAQVDHGETGLLVEDPYDLDGFGALLAEAAKGGSRIDDMGPRARDRVHRDFLPDAEVVATARLLCDGASTQDVYKGGINDD